MATDRWLRHEAGWRVRLGTVGDLRYPEIDINLGDAPELIDDWVDVDMGDMLHVDNLPPQHPIGGLDQIIQSWVDHLTPTSWVVAANTTPAAPWRVGTWEHSRWAPRSSGLHASVGSTDSTLFVDTPGVLWTTDPTHFPFDILLGPEQITVSGITGASNPQTFTVTRNVNGFARSHDAGTEVLLADAPILGL